MATKQFYLVQGVFFQHRDYVFGIKIPPMTESMPSANKLNQCMFSGLIILNAQGEGVHGASLTDHFGTSDLGNIILSDKEFSFVKVYDNGNEFDYSFKKKDGDFWIGTWNEQDEPGNNGLVRCLLIPIEETYFDPFKLQKLLVAV